jgi:hypothetical protein
MSIATTAASEEEEEGNPSKELKLLIWGAAGLLFNKNVPYYVFGDLLYNLGFVVSP